MRRTIQILMILIVALSSSSHLAVLQAVAWAGMFVGNAQEHELSVALSRTFGGDHPCGICQVVAEATEGDEGDDEGAPLPSGKALELKLVPLERVALVPPAPGRAGLQDVERFGPTLLLLPAVPPPRWV